MIPNWVNEKEVDLTIKLNDLCNTNCLHCNVHGMDKTYLDMKLYSKEVYVLLHELYNKGIRIFSVAFVGGEISLLPKKLLLEIMESFHNIVNLFMKSMPEIVEFDICLISNFIFNNSTKNHLLTFKQIINLFADIGMFKIVTSYDIGLNRFKNDKIYNMWKDNCSLFTEPLSLLVTLNKETCNNINIISDDIFFDMFNDISFQPMLDTMGDIKLMPTYKEIYKALEILKTNNKNYNILEIQKPKYLVVINNDGVISCAASEEVKLYDKRTHFNIKEMNSNTHTFSLMLENQLFKRIKATKNKICLSCENYEGCDFGFEFFDKTIICPVFKIQPIDD
jgi:hypothetical protein